MTCTCLSTRNLNVFTTKKKTFKENLTGITSASFLSTFSASEHFQRKMCIVFEFKVLKSEFLDIQMYVRHEPTLVIL
jgi:hypothetical protein